MKQVSERIIRQFTYKYADEQERDFHMDVMAREGFRPITGTYQFLRESSRLIVTYQKETMQDGIPRL